MRQVYVKNTTSGYVIVCLYVDDMLIMGSDNDIIKATQKMLNSKFDMEDLGVADVILGIKITRTSDGLILSQSHYIKKILEKFGRYDDSLVKTPIDVNLHLTKNKREWHISIRVFSDNWQSYVYNELHKIRHSVFCQQAE
jgi:hypothetical protein